VQGRQAVGRREQKARHGRNEQITKVAARARFILVSRDQSVPSQTESLKKLEKAIVGAGIEKDPGGGGCVTNTTQSQCYVDSKLKTGSRADCSIRLVETHRYSKGGLG
jgi:hypothetical protein